MTILASDLAPKARKICSNVWSVSVPIFRALPLSGWLVLAGLLTFLWFWIFGSKGLYEMEQLRGLRQELLDEKEKLAEEKKQLESELKHLNDPEYQRHIIHRELGYIKEDEALIQFHPKK